MFALLLLVVTGFTVYSHIFDHECDQNHYRMVFATQCLCLINLKLRNKQAQVLLHDAFAYTLGYGLLTSECTGFRTMTSIVATVMILTRIYFNKCLFLWWNTERNVDTDAMVVVLIYLNIFRTSSLISSYTCLILCCVAHIIPDKAHCSLLNKLCSS